MTQSGDRQRTRSEYEKKCLRVQKWMPHGSHCHVPEPHTFQTHMENVSYHHTCGQGYCPWTPERVQASSLSTCVATTHLNMHVAATCLNRRQHGGSCHTYEHGCSHHMCEHVTATGFHRHECLCYCQRRNHVLLTHPWTGTWPSHSRTHENISVPNTHLNTCKHVLPLNGSTCVNTCCHHVPGHAWACVATSEVNRHVVATHLHMRDHVLLP